MDPVPGEPFRPKLYPLALGLLIAVGVFSLVLLQRPTNIAAPQLPEGDRAAEAAVRLNPNTATRPQLMLLPQVGPSTADAIIAFREQADFSPAFRRLSDLTRVKGIGSATVEKLEPYLAFPDDKKLETNSSTD